MKGFFIVLKRIGPDVWQDEGPEYAHVVFNSIKDNPRYTDILCNPPNPTDDSYVKWIELYVNTVAKLPVFKDILPSVMQFLCEQLQHARFKAVRPTAMVVASKVGRGCSSESQLAPFDDLILPAAHLRAREGMLL